MKRTHTPPVLLGAPPPGLHLSSVSFSPVWRKGAWTGDEMTGVMERSNPTLITERPYTRDLSFIITILLCPATCHWLFLDWQGKKKHLCSIATGLAGRSHQLCSLAPGLQIFHGNSVTASYLMTRQRLFHQKSYQLQELMSLPLEAMHLIFLHIKSSIIWSF